MKRWDVFPKSVRALKYLKRKVPYFFSDINVTDGYVNKHKSMYTLS